MKADYSGKNKKGALTVEAIIILPLYILVILFIISFLNISYLQMAIQQGLNNAGRTLAQYGYALDVAVGIEQINTNAIDENVATIEPVVHTFEELTADITGLFSDFSFDRLREALLTADRMGQQMDTMTNALGSITGEDVVSYILTAGAESGASVLVGNAVDQYLREMKVNRNMLEDGIHYRVCMDDTAQDIVLIATYRYRMQMFIDGIDMRQIVIVHPWIGGSTAGVRQK